MCHCMRKYIQFLPLGLQFSGLVTLPFEIFLFGLTLDTVTSRSIFKKEIATVGCSHKAISIWTVLKSYLELAAQILTCVRYRTVGTSPFWSRFVHRDLSIGYKIHKFRLYNAEVKSYQHRVEKYVPFLSFGYSFIIL